MTRISPIKARKLIKFLKNKGFYTVVPFHPTKEISPGLLRKILDDIKTSPKELK